MAFSADKQTLEDLNLIGKFRPNSIFSLFNQVATAGGERLLEQLFREPLSDEVAINARSAELQHFQALSLGFPVAAAVFRTAENYLSGSGAGSYPGSVLLWWRKKWMGMILKDDGYEQMEKGLKATLSLLQSINTFIPKLGNCKQATALKEILHHINFPKEAPGLWEMARYDHLLRCTWRKKMEQLLEIMYGIDVWIAVTAVAKKHNFNYARASSAGNVMDLHGLRHPALEKAVANDLHLDGNKNMLFLTGANMAGKSTLMKSFGIAVYLAHMGFPVAAASMRFSVRDGLYSSINVADNLQQGYSHFYAEVLRVKTVAKAVSSGQRLVVIFDELFKGTNVKDAYDATLSVSKAFALYDLCAFIISTHITEVGEALQKECDRVKYAYLPTVMDGNVPHYTYLLSPGISSDRHGMMIIQNERILELLQ